MLSSSGLSKSFWVEAAATSVYLINIITSSTIGFKTPQEMWSVKPSKYHHLRVFGSVAYVHIKTDKLEPQAIKCIFVAYPNGVKGYKLWIEEPGQQKCIISRDVVFNELKMAQAQESKKEITHNPISDNMQLEVEQSQTHIDDQIGKFEVTSTEEKDQGGGNSYNLVKDRHK